MGAAPLESSSTPPHPPVSPSSVVDPSGSRGGCDLMEDTYSQSTRKRPRLDSGDRARESMSMSASSSPEREKGGASLVPEVELSDAAAVPVDNEAPPATPQRPQSRVTINMKSPTTPGSSAAPPTSQQSPTVNVAETGAPDISPQDDPTESNNVEPQPSGAISITSSPANSIEIEVADVEDMDEAPGTSNWRSLEDAMRATDNPKIVQIHEQISLVDSFPRIRQTFELREAIDDLGHIFAKGHVSDGEMFIALKNWLDLCLGHPDQMTYAACVEDFELWGALPDVVQNLLKRSIDFTVTPNDGRGQFRCIEEFFISYAKLCLHMIRLDIPILENLPDGTPVPELVSRLYVSTLGWMLQTTGIPFHKMLEKNYGAEGPSLLLRLNRRVARPPVDAIEQLSQFAKLLLKHLGQCPALTPTLTGTTNAVQNIVEACVMLKRLQDENEPNPSSESAMAAIIDSAYTMFRCVDVEYQASVSKKSAWITSETSETIIRTLGNMYQTFCQMDHQLAVQIANDLNINIPDDAKEEDYAKFIYYGWKFRVLKKHITEGRMELRVYGVETMQIDLVAAWKQYIQSNPNGIHEPVIQYLVKFLRDNEIVEYIVGIDSHPQIIGRSGNIAGFLVVTLTYTNHDTDLIWKTVTESQDSRTVTEVLSMLMRTFSLHTYDAKELQYICTKVLELPLNRFDTRMLEFCDQLLSTLRANADNARRENHDFHYVDVVAHRICVRLIREAASIDDFSFEQKTHLQKWASSQLAGLLTLGPSEEDKMEMFKQCIDDISEMNEFAVGSVHALNALTAAPYDNQDIRRLALAFDFTRLIIEEFGHAVDTASSDFSDPVVRNALVPRIHLIHRVVDKVPETITPELTQLLWDNLFMSKKIGDQGRVYAWEVLSKATARSGKRNPFLERFMNDYLPLVAPEDFGIHILAFAEQAVNYEIRFDPQPPTTEDEVVVIPGMERIWHIVLTAPPDTVEIRATNFAIDMYLDHHLIRRAPRSSAEATHVALVDRCVNQLTSAAARLKAFSDGTTSGEDEPMVIVPEDGEVRLEELRFSRSLLFLRQLLHGLRTRPLYTPPKDSPPDIPLKPEEVKGDLIELSYQAFSGTSQTRIRTLQIGDLSTASELVDKLVKLTGFSKFTTISAGQRLDLLSTPQQTLRDLKLTAGLLIIRKHPDATEVSTGRRQSLTLVDSEVLKHFDNLYDLLGLEERLSKEIFDFLNCFPPQQRVRDVVRSTEATEQEMFPLEKPYKLLYSISSLTTCMREELLEGDPDQDFASHCIRNLVSFLIRPEMSGSLEDSPLKLTFACNFVECLQLALRAKSVPDEPQPVFDDATKLAARLLSLIYLCEKQLPTGLSEVAVQRLIANSFAALIDASLHDTRVWDAVTENTQLQNLLYTLLLKENRIDIRKGVAEIIFTVCGSKQAQKRPLSTYPNTAPGLSRPLKAATSRIHKDLWKSVTNLLPDTVKEGVSTQEFFEVALLVFRTVSNSSSAEMEYEDYLEQWASLLLSHKTHEFVGREPIDYIILGFTHLIKLCLHLAGPTEIATDTSDFLERLFTTYLFPELSDFPTDEPIEPAIPVMNTETRQEMYNVLLLLCQNQDNCEKMLELLADVIPQDYTYEPSWVFDRYKTIRSPEGYAGLKNLSNTCYLNSLFTQLFMNVDFRKFMLNVPVSDMNASQRLLAETKKVFGYMQNTWQKCVDTQAAVDTIRTYDNEAIDINIQMDVDEFYNLLFDRWESQIMSDEDKKKFRSFYGGQLVQQIKSKECEHISERLEPFSAIQCDIKGKSGLEDSLRAYVEGEIMQGDNKYSCTSCGRHVDAVKRACLKDVPDNLIFHLKRFDFDVISMMRSKINDEFTFPERIDMTPFKVDYLSNPNEPMEPDVFELVGVLVHSGTAESGHYYSYIRERPTAADARGSWVEFNDADVSRFDPSKIADQCFGGDTFHGPGLGSLRFSKVWNAYMLFYQRVSSMETAKSVYRPSGDVPVSVPLSLDLENHISMENELFIRSYCLLDPYHAYFVRSLLEQTRKFDTVGSASLAKVRESAALVALDTLDQLIARTKEAPELDRITNEIIRSISESAQGPVTVLRWTEKRPLAIRNLLLKSPNSNVRSCFTRIIVSALEALQRRITQGLVKQEDFVSYHEEAMALLESVVYTLDSLWINIHLYSRAWDDYFEMLIGIASLGLVQVEVLLERGFLLKCLEILWLNNENMLALRRQYAAYLRLQEKGRKYSHFKLVDFLQILISHIDLTLPTTLEGSPRTCVEGKFSLDTAEVDYVRPPGRDTDATLVKKVLEEQANPHAARRIMDQYLNGVPDSGLPESVYRMLEEGLRVTPASSSVPFLEGALLFCQLASDEDLVRSLIEYAAKGVDSIGNCAGREHLGFFQALAALTNENIGKDEFWFNNMTTERAPDWAPALLHYVDRGVRNCTFEFIRELIIAKEYEQLDDESRLFYTKFSRELTAACVERLQRHVLDKAGEADPRTLETINWLIQHNLDVYYDENGSEEDAAFIEQATATLSGIEQLALEPPEEVASGSDFPSDAWEDSLLASDSDVGIAGSP